MATDRVIYCAPSGIRLEASKPAIPMPEDGKARE
jgi:hypothetical protein